MCGPNYTKTTFINKTALVKRIRLIKFPNLSWQALVDHLKRGSDQLTDSGLTVAERLIDSAELIKQSVEDSLQHWPGQRTASQNQLNAQTQDLLFPKQGYRGSRERQYRLFTPSAYDGTTPLPLVVVLHGCLQAHTDIEHISRFSTIAEREGFFVLYPFVTSYGGLRHKNCWGWWMASQIRPGAGEVEDLWQLIRHICEEYAIDEDRVHVTGLSSGAGMTVALTVCQHEHIASAAPVAGVSYNESAQAVNLFGQITTRYRKKRAVVNHMRAQMPTIHRAPPLFIVHSHQDDTVKIKAAQNLRDSWAECFDLPLARKSGQHTGETGTSRWHHTVYRRGLQRSHLETLWLEGPDHGWYGGAPGRFSFPNTLDISESIWRFFKTHPRASRHP